MCRRAAKRDRILGMANQLPSTLSCGPSVFSDTIDFLGLDSIHNLRLQRNDQRQLTQHN